MYQLEYKGNKKKLFLKISLTKKIFIFQNRKFDFLFFFLLKKRHEQKNT